MATRSCFIVAVETLINHSHLVHYLDIHQPNNSPRACASFKGTTRFSGVVPLSVGSKRVAAAGLVERRRPARGSPVHETRRLAATRDELPHRRIRPTP